MADNSGGMFGVDPAQYAQEQLLAQTNYNKALSTMDPLAAGKFAMMQGASQLGTVGQQLLGIQDPQLQAATELKQIAGQFDKTTPRGLMQLAQAIQGKYPEQAQQAVDLAQKMQLNMATVSQKMSEKIKQVGLSQDGQQVYQSGDEQYILGPGGQRLPYYGKFEGRQQKTSVDLGGLATLFAKAEANAGAKEITDQISKAQGALQAGSKISRDIAELRRILPATYTGQLSDLARTSSKTLSALGIPVSDKASNTEVATALFNGFVVPLIKDFPGSLAVKELEALQKRKPSALQEPATINRLLSMMEDDIKVNRVLVKKADAYKQNSKLNSLNGFNLSLEQDNIYQNFNKYNDIKQRALFNNDPKNKGQQLMPLTPEDAAFAKQFEKDLG